MSCVKFNKRWQYFTPWSVGCASCLQACYMYFRVTTSCLSRCSVLHVLVCPSVAISWTKENHSGQDWKLTAGHSHTYWALGWVLFQEPVWGSLILSSGTSPTVLIPHNYKWRVQMQKPLNAIWNFLLEWSFLSSLYI